MARKIRIEYAGAVYHVMARGNQGRRIYADDSDRKEWLETLAEACAKTGWRIHAWRRPWFQRMANWSSSLEVLRFSFSRIRAR